MTKIIWNGFFWNGYQHTQQIHLLFMKQLKLDISSSFSYAPAIFFLLFFIKSAAGFWCWSEEVNEKRMQRNGSGQKNLFFFPPWPLAFRTTILVQKAQLSGMFILSKESFSLLVYLFLYCWPVAALQSHLPVSIFWTLILGIVKFWGLLFFVWRKSVALTHCCTHQWGAKKQLVVAMEQKKRRIPLATNNDE